MQALLIRIWFYGANAAKPGVNGQTSILERVTGNGSLTSIPNSKMESYIEPATTMDDSQSWENGHPKHQ
ncbi:hypothetical protein GQF01_02260 [Paenibacillus sp. 5J-6]|uniref:Uncharacterized protein n=1 Tax=Paenibacillus silvestris TaxID=2606219 RepID=A0A6L8UUE6_9BACL|nr:hypothetical protein [Paenibacillus silvestris]MZQ80962.1 hypothetical protein [Paenibacillus silvestris]